MGNNQQGLIKITSKLFKEVKNDFAIPFIKISCGFISHNDQEFIDKRTCDSHSLGLLSCFGKRITNMENLPVYISLAMVLSAFLTAFFLFKAANYSQKTLIVMFIWLVFQTIMGLSGFYQVMDTIPPRFLLIVLPPVLFVVYLFISEKGMVYIDNLDQSMLTLLHVVRIPVEIVLFWLFLNNAVPELMTFEGRNFDILSGVSAIFVYYFGFVKKKMNKKVMLFWNFICLLLLINIVANAALSVPSPIQQFAFDQPNIGILYFPFNWLPSFIVPVVLFSHLAAIRQLVRKR